MKDAVKNLASRLRLYALYRDALLAAHLQEDRFYKEIVRDIRKLEKELGAESKPFDSFSAPEEEKKGHSL